jgi:hypothetical protein
MKYTLSRLAIYAFILFVLVPLFTQVPLDSSFSTILPYLLRAEIRVLIIIIPFEGIYRLCIYARRPRSAESQPTKERDARPLDKQP